MARVVLSTLLVACLVVAAGRDRVHASRVIVFVADKLAVEDLMEFPQATAPLHRSAEVGAVGLMNVRTGGSPTSANGYLSLSLGHRTVAGTRSTDAFSTTETIQSRTARVIYTGITGKEPRGAGVHLGIGELRARSGSPNLPLKTIGHYVTQSNVQTALLGTADTPGRRTRPGALLAMDGDGVIDHVILGAETIVDDPSWPAGFRTDYDSIFDALLNTAENSYFIVVELADLARLEEVAPFLEPAHAARIREKALVDLSLFVERVVTYFKNETSPRINEDTTVYLLSPSPPRGFGRQGITMTPVFRWTGSDRTGLLSSATTRRPGLVTNLDFVPSVLTDLDIAPTASAVTGRPWKVHEQSAALAPLLERYVAIREVHLQRLPVIQPYFFIVLGLFATGVFLAVAVQRSVVGWNLKRDTLWKATLGAISAYPLTLLILAGFPVSPLFRTELNIVSSLVGVALIIALLNTRLKLPWVEMIGLLTAVVIVGDIVTGARLMQGSLLGYDPIAGSRFYGIGNEYMGVLIGAALIGTAGILRHRSLSAQKLLWPSLLFIAMTVILAHPRLGINVGGAITAVAAAGATYFFVRDQAITLRLGLLLAAITASVLFAVGLIDVRLSHGNASHLGRIVALVSDAGPAPLWDMVARKVSINIRLIRLTIWSRVAMGSLALLFTLFLWPNRLANALKVQYPWLARMSRACLVSALVTLVVNDSGIVAAATLLLWPALAVLSIAPGLASRCDWVPE